MESEFQKMLALYFAYFYAKVATSSIDETALRKGAVLATFALEHAPDVPMTLNIPGPGKNIGDGWIRVAKRGDEVEVQLASFAWLEIVFVEMDLFFMDIDSDENLLSTMKFGNEVILSQAEYRMLRKIRTTMRSNVQFNKTRQRTGLPKYLVDFTLETSRWTKAMVMV